MKASNKVVYQNTFFLYIMTGAKFVLPLIITSCLTRRLGPDSYGVISYLTPVMASFMLFFDFGFNFSATKKISQNRDNKMLISKTIAAVYTSKMLLVLAGLVILIILIACVNILKDYLLVTVLYYIATAAQIFIPDFLYRGIEKMQGITIRYILAKLITAILIFTLVKSEDQLLVVPLAYLLGTVIAAVYTNRHMVLKLGYSFGLSNIKQAVAELRVSTVYFASTFATMMLSGVNTFVMGIVNMPTAQIAYWGVALQVVQAIQSMYEPITTSIYPYVVVKKDYKFVLRITVGLLPIVLIGCIALYWLAQPVVMVIAGSEYLAAVSVLRYLIPLLFFAFVVQMLGFPLLGAVGHQKQVMITTVAAAVFHVMGMVVLILTGNFSLFTLSVLRVVSEFIFMVMRIYYVIVFLKKNRVEKGWQNETLQ